MFKITDNLHPSFLNHTNFKCTYFFFATETTFAILGTHLWPLSVVKQRLYDNFIQNWNSWLREFSRASFYSGVCSFHYHYLNFVRVKKYRQETARLWCSSHRLEIEAGRCHKPIRTPVENKT